MPLPRLTENLCFDTRLERLWDFIQGRYSDSEIALGEAARHSGVSGTHLNSVVEAYYGIYVSRGPYPLSITEGCGAYECKKPSIIGKTAVPRVPDRIGGRLILCQ